ERTFAHVKTCLPNGIWKKESEYGAFLDWPTHHNPEAELAGAQALAVLAMDDLRFLLSESGRTVAADGVGRLLERMRTAHPDPRGAKSAAAMLALAGLREPSEMFATTLGRNGHAGVSTFYGYYMIEAMSQAGQGRHALDTVRDYWGGMLDMGATSFWEDFNLAWTNNAFRIDEIPVAGKKDVHGDYGEFCYKGLRHSLCHGWSSGPAAWCISHVLGICPIDVGCRTVVVKPFLGDLEWAEGAMALPTGESVRVRADRQADGEPSVRIDAPAWVRIVRGFEK
ncbi:MAG: alpha-L-rhamnosidase, partial [bacterium]|nr:alpha-L-rhamnosidase [Candidatus Colisoma equi]